jgi:cytochrome c-type biogenesis protein CcmH
MRGLIMPENANAGAMSPKQTDLVAHIEHLLMAPCCYTQTIDLHMSDVARDMRKEVAAMVLSGQTEQQVFDHYKALYGEKILAIPDGRLGTAAFAIPIMTATVATSGLLYFLHRFHKRKSLLRTAGPLSGVALVEDNSPAATDDLTQLRERIRRDTAW